MKIGDDGDIIAEAHKGEIIVRCKFCSTGYVLNKEEHKDSFACENCQKLDDYIKDKKLFLEPLDLKLKHYLSLKLDRVEHDILTYANRILIYTNGGNDISDFCFMSEFENTIFGDIQIFLFVKNDGFWIQDLVNFEKDLKEIL